MKHETRRSRKRQALALVSPEGLLAPLNRAHPNARARELADLVSILAEIERKEAVRIVTEIDLKNGGVRGRDPRNPYLRANLILSKCNWSPRVSPQPNRLNSFTWKAPTEQRDWENLFVFWLLNCRAEVGVSLVRKCRNCGQWFYAVTSHQVHCTDRCRQQFHSKDLEFKEKRRLYMHRYRLKEKMRNLVARKQARGE